MSRLLRNTATATVFPHCPHIFCTFHFSFNMYSYSNIYAYVEQGKTPILMELLPGTTHRPCRSSGEDSFCPSPRPSRSPLSALWNSLSNCSASSSSSPSSTVQTPLTTTPMRSSGLVVALIVASTSDDRAGAVILR